MSTIQVPIETIPPVKAKNQLLPLLLLLSHPKRNHFTSLALPLTAFAISTALILTVIGGTMMFWHFDQEQTGGIYKILSSFALAILMVPLLQLASSAVKLSARRKDELLATLKLLGANNSLIFGLTVLEATAVAFIGTIFGAGLYLLATPLVGLLHFGGEAIGQASLWVGFPVMLGAMLLITLVAAASSLLGIRRVIISPLGVRTKEKAEKNHWVRLVIGVAVLLFGFMALSALQVIPGLDLIFVFTILIGVFAAGIAILNVIGPWLLGLGAKLQVKRAKQIPALIAARATLESPKAAWRQVSGMAMISFIAVIAGSGFALLSTVSQEDNTDDLTIVGDISTGILVTLVAGFLTVACSVGVTQAAAVYERKELNLSLDRIGVPLAVIEKSRILTVMFPLIFVVLWSAGAAVLLALPVVGASLVINPLSLVVLALTFAVGFGLVYLALLSTKPLLVKLLQS